MKPIRQGDVWLYPIDVAIDLKRGDGTPAWVPSAPLSAGDPDVLLALGEVTGHAHRIAHNPSVLLLAQVHGSRRVLRVKGADPVLLTHEEHETLTIPPGDYEVRIQREYVPGKSARYVMD